jgi:hypothetical protein
MYDASSTNHTHGGAYCGVAIIIVVDVQMDLGDGGGEAVHKQGNNVSEPQDARCVAVECVWLRVGNWIVCLWLFVHVYQSNTILLVVVVVVQVFRWTCCSSRNYNSTYCRMNAYCEGCTSDVWNGLLHNSGVGSLFGVKRDPNWKHYKSCQRYGKN